ASYVRQHLSNKFNLNGTITLTINTNNSNLGKIIINKAECNLTSNKYSGIYFKNIPIVIKAEPAEGCSFTGWTGITGPDSLLIYTDKNLELTANFAKNSPIKNLYINEIMADNKSSNKDEFGEYDDWVEIYNNSNDTINIAGLYFTDNFKNKAKCRIASTDKQKTKITPKSFLVLWADEQPEQGILHINTKLAAEGELAGLFQVIEKDTILIDTIYFGTQYKNLSYGRYPDGGSKKTILSSPTPGESNIYNSISNEQGDINLDFYPNPAKNKLIINITTGSDNKALFNIFSCNGKIVKQLEIKSQGNINKRIEIKLVDNNNTQLPGGIYYINYIDNNINITKKLVIIK
nr:lamin tail domain-containing protein [Bacteroidales bacterium]